MMVTVADANVDREVRRLRALDRKAHLKIDFCCRSLCVGPNLLNFAFIHFHASAICISNSERFGLQPRSA